MNNPNLPPNQYGNQQNQQGKYPPQQNMPPNYYQG